LAWRRQRGAFCAPNLVSHSEAAEARDQARAGTLSANVCASGQDDKCDEDLAFDADTSPVPVHM
jgi:hypothetical protein